MDKKLEKLDDTKKFSILRNEIRIKGQKVRKQVRDQRSMETNKDDAQLLLKNKNNCYPYSDCIGLGLCDSN